MNQVGLRTVNQEVPAKQSWIEKLTELSNFKPGVRSLIAKDVCPHRSDPRFGSPHGAFVDHLLKFLSYRPCVRRGSAFTSVLLVLEEDIYAIEIGSQAWR